MNPAIVGAVAAGAGVVLLVMVVHGFDPVLADLRIRRRGSVAQGAGRAAAGDDVLATFSRIWHAMKRVVAGGDARLRHRADRDLVLLLDQVTRHLRAGASLSGAVQAASAGRADPSTANLASDLLAGTSLSGAVDRWRVACPTPARDLAAAALILAADAGGSVAAVLDGVTDTMRDRVALEREVAALSSQARASAGVLVVAPIVFAVLAAVADPRVAQMLLGQPLGWACVAAGAVLDGLGALWMRRLVGRSR